MDGVGTYRWEVEMITREKWRGKPEGKKISNFYKRGKKSR